MEERCAGSDHPQKNRAGGASQAEVAMLELLEVCGMIVRHRTRSVAERIEHKPAPFSV